MESIIRDHILEFFLQNSYFREKHYGRSTVLQILKIMDDWTAQVDVIYPVY